MPGPLLALETSGAALGVALWSQSAALFSRNVVAGATHGKALAPLIDEALRSQSLDASGLGGVAVSLGPGSWTGLRIGLSAAKALAWAAGVPLVGVPSFEAFAIDASTRAPGRARLLLRDARSEGFFVALFSETRDPAERWIEENVFQPAQAVSVVREELARRGNPPLVIAGDPVCLAALAAAAGESGWQILNDCTAISADAVAACGWKMLERGAAAKNAAEVHAMRPMYLRASDPELKLARKRATSNEK